MPVVWIGGWGGCMMDRLDRVLESRPPWSFSNSNVCSQQKQQQLDLSDVGGNSHMFYFYPDPWGNDPIWRAYFSNWLVQPPTSFWCHTTVECDDVMTPLTFAEKRYLKLRFGSHLPAGPRGVFHVVWNLFRIRILWNPCTKVIEYPPGN